MDSGIEKRVALLVAVDLRLAGCFDIGRGYFVCQKLKTTKNVNERECVVVVLKSDG